MRSVLVFLAFVCAVAQRNDCLPPPHDPVPCLEVPQCRATFAVIDGYVKSDGSGPAQQNTRVQICYDSSYLHIAYVATDNNPYTRYSECADPVWNDDALELMIAPGLQDPVNYTEIDLSPKNALWGGHIFNPSGKTPQNTTMIPCTTPGLQWHARIEDPGWTAVLTVPLPLIGGSGTTPYWRANFYRTDQAKDAPQREFSAWSATRASPPNFHIPAFFGVLHFV
eukprot:TRINITY_DN95359_c0_g1_i1.p1 TRINITY_DN95359_c0_g1~~TRINITY_DN95359_c0_g1_i1.p1  ORF type:complete len:231 (-),score=33.50 TRINITY_DN95359_c0_g1_i1:2-673(-)